MRPNSLPLIVATLAAIPMTNPAAAVEMKNADEIVAAANLASYYAGGDGRSEVRMIIRDAQGREQRRQFTVLRRNVGQGGDQPGDQQFLVVFSRPSDVRGDRLPGRKARWVATTIAGFTCRGSTSSSGFRPGTSARASWGRIISTRTYPAAVPMRIRTSWTGTTDDHYVLRHVPRDPSSVEFASYVTWIDRESLLPTKIEYANSAGDVYRRVEVIEVQDVQGYPTVTKSRVSNLESGGHTDMQFRYIAYDLGMPADVFTERSLRNPPKQWLQRPGE